jgi:hypothetical protein
MVDHKVNATIRFSVKVTGKWVVTTDKVIISDTTNVTTLLKSCEIATDKLTKNLTYNEQ